ncbi:hypothetical protein [Actinoplanes rectilineatus]|uniref:hypothetical protein n=1 Tax=Actinoplanes rectilineatus TaxID=113571 RepID=UPI000B0051A9|nr:hypothetical protein [Actinoplanes rectilineatus]
MSLICIGPIPLPAGTLLYPCMVCGVAVPEKGRVFHDDWHHSVAEESIETARRVRQIEANRAVG